MRASAWWAYAKRHQGVYTSLVLLLAGISFFHWRGIRPGYAFLPVDLAQRLLPWRDAPSVSLQNWLISDPLYQFYPFLIQSVAGLQSGQPLLWNPAILSGHPALADPLFQTFYPVLALLSLAVGPARGFTLGLVAHSLAAGLMMFGFLRSQHLRPTAAAGGAFIYALSGYMVTWFEFPFWLTTLTWLPGILWAYQWAVDRGRWRLAGAAGLLYGVALLAGQYQFIVIFSLFWGMYAVALAILSRRAGHHFLSPLLIFLIALCIGWLIGSIQILNLAELLALSRRSLGASAGEALPLSQLVTLLLPNAYGNPTWAASYWGFGNYNEQTIYMGIVAVFFAWLALFRRPRYWPAFLLFCITLLLWFAVGGPGTSFLLMLPVFHQITLHRSLFLLPLLVAWLTAYGIDDGVWSWQVLLLAVVGLGILSAGAVYLTGNHHPTGANALLYSDYWFSTAFVVGTALLLFGRRQWPHRRSLADSLIVGLIFVNLFWFGHSYNPTGKITELFPATATTQFLQTNSGLGRVAALQRGDALLFGPNLLATYGAQEPGGYSSLVAAAYHELISRGDPEVDSPWLERSSNFVLLSHPSERLLDLLNIELLVSPEVLPDPGPATEIAGAGCSGQAVPLRTGEPLAGQWRVWHSAINRIDIPLAPANAGGSETGSIHLRIRRDGADGVLIVDAAAPIHEVLQQPQWTVYFAPETGAPGRDYLWQLSVEGSRDASLEICTDHSGAPALSVYGARMSEVELAEENGVHVYRRYAPFYRAAVVYAAQPAMGTDDDLDRLLDPAFDARNIALTDQPLDLPPQPARPATQAEIVVYENNRVVIQATAEDTGLLVLADQEYPGWQATVDGIPAPILRVNHVMRGVELSAGEHTVTFTFAPRPLQIGAVLTSLGLFLVILLLVWDRRRANVPMQAKAATIAAVLQREMDRCKLRNQEHCDINPSQASGCGGE